MNEQDVIITVNRYSERYKKHGYSPATLGWGENGRQHLRFCHLYQVGQMQGKSVLDVGCGFGDLYGYLVSRGWEGHYTGIDMVPELIAEGKSRYADAELINADFESFNFQRQFDYVLASGIFNLRLSSEDNWSYITRVLSRMFELAKVAVAVDFMTTWVDFQRPEAFHTDPAELLNKIRPLTNRFVIRQDYMPYEYCVYLYKNTKKKEDNTFEVL